MKLIGHLILNLLWFYGLKINFCPDELVVMSLEFKKIYLLLGSNLGNRQLLLKNAIDLIDQKVGDVFAQSAVYETAAWGKTDQPGFLNVAIGVQTKLTPLEVLDSVLQIETKLGRVREEKWGSRLIDIDIIFYEDEVIQITDRLIIPHPEMQYRKFVLQPLSDIASDFIHPVTQQNIAQMLSHLSDTLAVKKLTS